MITGGTNLIAFGPLQMQGFINMLRHFQCINNARNQQSRAGGDVSGTGGGQPSPAEAGGESSSLAAAAGAGAAGPSTAAGAAQSATAAAAAAGAGKGAAPGKSRQTSNGSSKQHPHDQQQQQQQKGKDIPLGQRLSSSSSGNNYGRLLTTACHVQLGFSNPAAAPFKAPAEIRSREQAWNGRVVRNLWDGSDHTSSSSGRGEGSVSSDGSSSTGTSGSKRSSCHLGKSRNAADDGTGEVGEGRGGRFSRYAPPWAPSTAAAAAAAGGGNDETSGGREVGSGAEACSRSSSSRGTAGMNRRAVEAEKELESIHERMLKLQLELTLSEGGLRDEKERLETLLENQRKQRKQNHGSSGRTKDATTSGSHSRGDVESEDEDNSSSSSSGLGSISSDSEVGSLWDEKELRELLMQENGGLHRIVEQLREQGK